MGPTPSDTNDPGSKRRRHSGENLDADDNIEESASPSQKKSKTQEIFEAESDDDFFDTSDEAAKLKQKGEKEKTPDNPPVQEVEVVELGTTDDTSTPANDSSIILLDDLSSDTNAKEGGAMATKPKVRAPVIALSSIEDGSSNGMTQSATIFPKLTKKHDSSASPSPSSKTSSGAEATAAMVANVEDKAEKNKPTTTEESEVETTSAAQAEEDADIHFIADDEASMSFSKDKSSRPDSGLASRTGLTHLLTDSPDLSVSPIHHENLRKNDAFRSERKTSTPGSTPATMKRSPKKRPHSSRPLSPSSDDDSGVQKSDTKKRKNSPKKKNQSEEKQLDSATPNLNETAKIHPEAFKVPEAASTEDYAYFILCGGPQGLNKQEMLKIKNLLPSEISFTEHKVTKDKSNELFKQLHDSLDGNLEHPRPICKKRISDVTSLSSNSRSSSTSTGGYLADGSGSSTVSSSNGSKRDRLSIMPELTVHKHSVISPLPGRFKRKNESVGFESLPLKEGNHSKNEAPNIEKAQSAPILEETEEQIKDCQEKGRSKESHQNDTSDGNDSAYVAETQVDVPAYDMETQESDHQPMLASTPDLTPISASKSEEPENERMNQRKKADLKRTTNSGEPQSTKLRSNDEFFVYPDSLVFAKFKEKTLVRYWPAKVLSLENEIAQKWNVEFELDKFKSCLETCELIPADSLSKLKL